MNIYNTGQIEPTSSFGELIKNIASLPEVNTIVDVGTWSGLGTTLCIIQGIQGTDKKLFSVELYPNMYTVAQENLKGYMNDNIKLLNGRLINRSDIEYPLPSDMNPSCQHYQLYYHTDMEYLDTQPLVIDELPDYIDLLILDGGEYTTYTEYQKLKGRFTWLVMDDSNVLKCKRIKEELLVDPSFECVFDAPNEKHGQSIFRKIA